MYDAREKANLDIQSNLMDARQVGRQEGREEGRQEGIEIGEQRGEMLGKLKASIQIYEGLLGDIGSSDSELSNRSVEALDLMVTQLQKRLRNRTK